MQEITITDEQEAAVAILFAVFGLILGYFGAGDNIIVLVIATLLGGLIGFVIGKKMEASAKND